MNRLFFGIAAVLLLGVGVYQYFNGPAPATAPATPPAPPERQFQNLLAGGDVDAGQLGRLCEAYPALANRLLKNRPIRLTGNVLDFQVSGMGGRRAAAELYRGSRLQLFVILDLDHYNVIGVDAGKNHSWRHIIVENELLLIDPGHHRRAVLFTRQTPYAGFVTFDRVSETLILVSATYPHPSWTHD